MKRQRWLGLLWIWTCLASFFIGFKPCPPAMAQNEKAGPAAVLPFRIHAFEPLDHLQKGLQEEFSQKLSEKGVPVIEPSLVNKHPNAFLTRYERQDIFLIGSDLKADWIVSGSLTQIGRRISLDIKAYDMTSEKPPFSIFMVEEGIDRLPDATLKAVNSIVNQILGAVQIDDIQVTGNRRIESAAILASVRSQKGEQLDSEKLDEDLRAIFKMGYFREVNIETQDGPRGKIIIFRVKEKPSIGRISFQNNKKLSDKDLKEEVGIAQYAILNQNEIRQSVKRLKDLYREKGYYNIKIKTKIEDLPQNEVSLTYEIDEGKKIYIKAIEFEGNTYFDDGDLRGILETKKKSILSLITKAGLLDMKKLEFDTHKISSFYRNHGFLKVKVGEPQVTYDEGLDGLRISIAIIEGAQYTVREVDVIGTTEDDLILPKEDFMKMVRIPTKEYFSHEVVRNDILTIRNYYADDGFAYAEVSPIIKEDDEKNTVDIAYKISKGKKVRFERINITGNTVTRDKVIRRELRMIEGEYFSRRDLQKSTENLHRLGFFEDVEIQPRKGSSDDLMVLNVNVKERPTGSFSIGAGYSSYESLIGMFSISQNNLFGRGQKLQGSARIGGKTAQFDVRFTEPWFLDYRLSLGANIYNWKREYDEYDKDSLGAGIRIGFPIAFDEYTWGSVDYTYDDSELSNIDPNASLIIQDQAGNTVTSSMKFGLRRDSRDKPFNTTRGSFNSVSFEYAGGIFGGDAAFNKAIGQTAWFFPLPWDTVIMGRGRIGYVSERSSDGRLPIYQKFRIGGINTVRGYDFGEISPRDPKTGDAIGGEEMLVFNFEYTFPFIKEQGVVGVVFFDAGNVWTEPDSYDITDLKQSVGVRVRWYSPMGPLRFEYGRKISPEPDESDGGFEFAMGGTF